MLPLFRAKSHFIVGNALMEGLAKAGHEVQLLHSNLKVYQNHDIFLCRLQCCRLSLRRKSLLTTHTCMPTVFTNISKVYVWIIHENIVAAKKAKSR